MNFVQNASFPEVEIPPAEGKFSYRNQWDVVMAAFREAGLRVGEPPEERRVASPCADFAWFFVVEGLDQHTEVLVTDQEITPEREAAILRGAFGVMLDHPETSFHIYSHEPISDKLRTALSDSAAGRFLRRVGVEVPIGDIRPMGVPHVAPRIARILAECWAIPFDLDEPGEAMETLDGVVMEFRGKVARDKLLEQPKEILTPPLAALGLLVAEILRRHLPGPARIHATIPHAEVERQSDDRLKNQDWAFVMAVAGSEELQYVYGPGRVFTRYCQGDQQRLIDLLPSEIAHPESEAALSFVESLPDDPSAQGD